MGGNGDVNWASCQISFNRWHAFSFSVNPSFSCKSTPVPSFALKLKVKTWFGRSTTLNWRINCHWGFHFVYVDQNCTKSQICLVLNVVLFNKQETYQDILCQVTLVSFEELLVQI